MEIQEILEKVKNGAMSVEEAEGFLRREPFEEMGYAKLDMHRKVRSGFAEVIYCAGKADEHLNVYTRQMDRFSEREQHSISTKYCVKNIRR